MTTRSPFAARGDQVYVELTGLSAGVDYLVTATGGQFTATNTNLIDVTGGITGAAQLVLGDTSTVPATVGVIGLTLSQNGSVVSQDSVPFAEPEISIVNLCPASSAGVIGRGFADGDYVLTGDHLVFSPTVAHVTDGSLAGVSVRADGALPSSFSVTASIDGTSTQVASSGQQRAIGRLVEDDNGYTPWSIHYDGSCFAPGEKIKIRGVDSPATATVTADAHGDFKAAVALHPATAPHTFSGAEAEGLTSGQTAQGRLSGPVYGTTLMAGQKLRGVLASSSPGYTFDTNCNPAITWVHSDGSGSFVWRPLNGGPRSGSCTIELRANGDLVDLSASGKLLWHTATAGTGLHNRLTMTNSGNLVLATAAGTVVWTSKGGRSADPTKATLLPGHRLSLGQPLVRGAWALTLRQDGDLVLTESGHVRWRSKTTGSHASYLTLTNAGKLSLYRADQHVVWTAPAHAGSRSRLVLQSAGNLVLYTAARADVWATQTGN